MIRYFSGGQGVDPTKYVTLVYAEAQATANTTTSSGTPSLLNGMTLTPLEGVYQVWFSASNENTGAGLFNTPEETIFQVYVDGVAVGHSRRENTAGDGGRSRGVAINCRVEVDGTQDVEVRWSVTGGTATCFERTLSVFKLADST